MNMRERFEKRGFSVTKYARALGVQHSIVTRVLDGKMDGSRYYKSDRSKNTRRVIAQLKKDGIWIGPLPWEMEKDRKGAA